MLLPVDLEPIATLIRRIVERLDPEEIWLFGSRAEGRGRPDSDYDLLAVLADGAPEADLDLVKAWEITCGLGIPADLVPCTRSDFEGEKDEVGTLPRAAYHRGRLIYERARAKPWEWGTVLEAKTQLSRLLDRAEAGEEVIIARAGHPVARLVPITSGTMATPRILGALKGKGWMADDFDAPLDADFLIAPDASGRR